MNEVNMLNIGGIDYNVDDQYARDVIAHSENGLDSQSNLPVSSRHYDEGDYLIGQDRFYYEAITDIEIGDTLVVGTNLRQTILSDEIVRLKNQSSLAVIQCIAFNEVGTTASKDYAAGQYLYWDYGLDAGLYETITAITSGDSFSIGVNIKSANKIIDIVDGLQDGYNITGAKNLCIQNAVDKVDTDITFDVLSDGSVQVSGTAAAVGRYLTMGSTTLPAGTYTLTTSQANEASAPVALYCRQNGTSTILGTSNANPTFTLAQNTKVDFYLYTVVTGTAMNVRVFPMCRVASVTDDTYVPYAMTNRQLTTEISNMKIETAVATMSNCSGNSKISFRKFADGTVNARGYIQLSSDVGSGGSVTVGKVSSSFAPQSSTSYYQPAFPVGCKTGGSFKNPCMLIIDSNGNIVLHNPSTNGATLVYGSFYFTYDVNIAF